MNRQEIYYSDGSFLSGVIIYELLGEVKKRGGGGGPWWIKPDVMSCFKLLLTLYVAAQ